MKATNIARNFRYQDSLVGQKDDMLWMSSVTLCKIKSSFLG